MEEQGKIQTFWKLINSYEIVIPQLQRDYAQGRKENQAIEQIRNSLVEELYDSVTGCKPFVLNFIYGENKDGRFIPVDGQQRLTTLFLLHWYIFSRADDGDGLALLNKFSYKTRDTSKRFCQKICEIKIDFSADSIDSQIKECYWFTGNFMADPTIQSMLVMLNTIHAKFFKWTDFKQLKDHLVSEECPVSFLWLPMDNFRETNDLYIKMNARGKLLSDFEIFKAKLQNSELLGEILGKDVTDKKKILYISKYNNQYAELFYQMFQEEFDAAMMDFVKEMIRDAYLCYVSECGVPQKEYRADYNRIGQMNGSVFFRFIENGGTGYSQCKEPRKAIVKGVLRMTDLLDKFSSMRKPLEFENTLQKNYYNEKYLFQRNHTDEVLSEDVVRYALYAFLSKFGVPEDYAEKNAYSLWKRFVYNLVTNSVFASRREDVCEAFAFFEKTVNSIICCDEISVLKSISGIRPEDSTAAIRHQLGEEVIKSKLIQDAEWKREILDAEDYFHDGQIGTILEFSKRLDGTYEIEEFNTYMKLMKKLFDGNKNLINKHDVVLFERALLCMPDHTSNQTGHLIKQANSTTSWGFQGESYKELLKNSTDINKRNILKALLDQLRNSSDFHIKLVSIVENIAASDFADNAKWKVPFIQNPKLFSVIMGGYKFRNCINLENNNREVLLLAGTTVRAYSMELNTFLLYQLLQEKEVDADLVLSTTAILTDHDNFPVRYIDYKDLMIGYSYQAEYMSRPYICKDEYSIIGFTFDEIVEKILALHL